MEAQQMIGAEEGNENHATDFVVDMFTIDLRNLSSKMSGKFQPETVHWKNFVFPAMLLPLFVLEFVGVISLTGLFIIMSVSMVAVVCLVNYYTADRSTPEKTQNKIHEITHFIEDLFHELDYNLLIIFTGLFIVSGSFLHTGIPSFFWNAMAGSRPFQTGTSIFVISVYIIVFSQLVGNVPLVYLAKTEVLQLDRQPQVFGWLILAFVSTIAGNFTLVGSAANIIVVEKAMR
jgi:Na+/H+ antiporter NhaD/arsenite permease-like protein